MARSIRHTSTQTTRWERRAISRITIEARRDNQLLVAIEIDGRADGHTKVIGERIKAVDRFSYAVSVDVLSVVEVLSIMNLDTKQWDYWLSSILSEDKALNTINPF